MKHLSTMKHINPMKYINTMKHIITISYRKSLICAVTLLIALGCPVPLHSESVTYSGTETIYFNRYPSRWSWFGDDYGNGAAFFAYFYGESGFAWSCAAMPLPGDDYWNVLMVNVPKGTWDHMILIRQDAGSYEYCWPEFYKKFGGKDNNDNQSADIELQSGKNYLTNFRNKSDGNWDKWEWSNYSMYDANKPDGIGNTSKETVEVCQQSIDNNDVYSLLPLWTDDKSGYREYHNHVLHVWARWVGDHWVPVSDNWDDFNEHLIDQEKTYYYLFTTTSDNKRFICLERKACAVNSVITSFEYVLTPVNVKDSTYSVEGMVAFSSTAPGKTLEISCDGKSDSKYEPESPCTFSISGLKADGKTKTVVVRYIGVVDEGGPIENRSHTFIAPVPTSGVGVYPSTDELHYVPAKTTYIHNEASLTSPIKLIPSPLTTDSFSWADSKDSIWASSQIGGDNFYNFTNSYGFDTTIVLYYTEYNLPPVFATNMMGNGDFKDAEYDYASTSDYTYTGKIWDGSSDDKRNVYNHWESSWGDSHMGIFGITTNANVFWFRMADVAPKTEAYFEVIDGDKEEKVAWKATTDPIKNPKLTLVKGTTYMFSFWVANVNNYGEMVNRDNINNARLQFKIEYTDTDGGSHVHYLGNEINLNEYKDNLWHQNSATFTSDYDADDVTISVVDKNTSNIPLGNDFALDDIRFRAVSVQSGTIRTRERFELKFVEPAPEVKDVTIEPVTYPACEDDKFSFKVNFKYKTNTPHTINLNISVSGFAGEVGNTTTLTNTAGEWVDAEYVFATTSSDPSVTTDTDIRARTGTMKATVNVSVTDAKSVTRSSGDIESDAVTIPRTPVLTLKEGHGATSIACDASTFSVSVKTAYTYFHGDKIRVKWDGTEKTDLAATITKRSTTAIDYETTVTGLTADGKKHTLLIYTGNSLDCGKEIEVIAPKGNSITAFAVSAIEPACDETKYKLHATWTVTKADVSGSVYDNLIIAKKNADNSLTTLKTIPAASVASGEADLDGQEYDLTPATHPTIVAYLEERYARDDECYTTAAGYDHPVVPQMEVGTPTFEAIECNKSTFNLVVPVTYTNQHGDMYVWVDSKTPVKVTDAMCKTGAGLSVYTKDTKSSLVTKVVITNLELTGEHYVNVMCDGEGACARTKANGKETSFPAPILPSVDRVFKSYSTPTCNDPYTTLTFDFKYANQPAGTIEMWVDDDKTSDHMITLASASGGYTPTAALKTLENQKIKFVPADSLDTHILHIKSGSCDETFTLPQVPFMPKIEDVSVSWPSTLSCGASDKYTATVTVTSSNCRNATLCVSLNDGTPQEKNPNSGSQTFTFTDLPANGSSNTVKAWFKCVGESCNQTETFTAPTLPKASVVLPESMPAVAACDQPTFDLEFKLKYTYQDGELQVWVARAGDATKYGLKTFTASLSDGDGKYIKLDKDENTKNITLTGLPSDGRSDYKLYFKFNESGYCGYSSPIETALLTFPRSPTIDSVRVTGVPSKVADCTVDKYIAYVKVWYRYTSGEDLIIRYTDNAGVAHIEGPFTLVGNPHNQSVTLNDIGKGSKELYAYFFGSDCQTTPQHTGEYVAPSNSAINGDYKVRVKENKSTCGNLLYDLTGTITYEGDATANLVVKFDNKDSVIIAHSACSGSGTTFVIPNLTKAVKNKTLIAYFLDQPKCTAASDKFDSPDTCRYDVPTASMSYSPAVCGETLTSLTFNLTYTYQSGTLKYWRDASDKKTATFKTNNDTTFTIEGLTLGGFPADSMTHKFYVQFEGGRCPDVKEFTTPEASFSPKVSNFKLKEITNELCNFDTYSAVVTFDVQNGQNKYIVAECKGKSAKRQIPSDGSYSLQIDGITRANPLNDFEVIRLYFPSADICSPNDTIRFKEKPKPALVKIEVEAAPETTCDKTEYTLTGRLGYRNIKATPRVWLDDVSSDDKKTALDGYKSGFSTDEYIEFQLTVPADGKTHTVHADVTGWECAITPVDHDALWRPAVKDVKWTAPEFVHCDEPYDVKLEIEYERGVTGKNIYAWCTDHSAKIESSAALANGTGKATITLSNLTDRDNGWHNLTIYFDGMEASCPITSYKYNAPKTKTLTLGAPTANTVECGDPAFSITGSVTSNVTSGVVIVTDGTHSDEFDLASRTTYTISGLTTGGSLTAQFKGHNCSKTDAKTFSAVALKPIPTFSLKDITPQCYPAKEFAIGYEHTNAQTIVYTVNSGDEQFVDVNASNEFTINTTGWADGEYTITASAVSADDCPSASSSSKKLIIRKQPKISIEQLDDACDDASSTALKVKTTAAISYNYYIVGETQLLATPVTVAADGEYTPGLNIGMLNVGDAAKTYTLKMVANSENCVSDTVRKDFTIYPLPKLSFEDIEPACYPASSVEVTYNPTNVKEFLYTVKTKDGSDTKISNQLVTVGATKQFTITTDGWAAGEYTLTAVATSMSEKGCTANASSVDFTILAKPTAEITKILNQCDNEGTTTVTYKAANATKFIYKIEGVMSDWSSEEDVELDGSGTGTFSLSISALNVGETAKEYTVKFKTKSASCESDETSGKFTIYPLPTLTITNTTINTCYPTETTLVPYTSKNAATYTYTLSGNGISPLSETKSAEASGNIPVNTDGLAAGTYDLNVTAKSAATAGSCDIATVATGTIIIQAQPTASIVDIADQCDYVDDITVEFSAENASEFRYKIDGEPNWSSWAGIPASNKFSLDISGLNVGDVKTKYTLMLETKKGSCTSETATKDFYILPIPTVTFNPSAIIIRTDVENVDVKLSFTNATTFDYSFVDEDNNVILDQKATGVTVSSNPLSLNLNTKDIGKGTYILKVTPHSTCEGTPNTLDVIVNDKPSIDFPGELVECEGTEYSMSVGYMASYDAKRLTYRIEKKEGDVYSPLVAEQTITLADYPSPFSIDVKNLVYGTYYISGYVVSLNPDESVLETGDLIRKEFTILAKPQENKVTQDVKFIGCGEEYSAKIVVNTFNAVGRTIIAEYSDNGGNHKLTDVAGAETATFDLSGLKDVGATAGEKKTVTVSIEGVDCGITVEYEMPQLMTIEPNFIVEPQPRTCDATTYTVKGTVVANCNEGKIVVEYDATHKSDPVDASTTGTEFTIDDIPVGGSIYQLKAYFEGKDCGIVPSEVFAELPAPAVSMTLAEYTGSLGCTDKTYPLQGTIKYTYIDAAPTLQFDSENPIDLTPYIASKEKSEKEIDLNDLDIAVPADGREHTVTLTTSGWTAACPVSPETFTSKQKPIITGVEKVSVDKEFISCGESYTATIKVNYKHAYNKQITIEYTDNGISSQTATSAVITNDNGQVDITIPSLNDHGGTTALTIYIDDETCAYTAASITQPKLNSIDDGFTVNKSDNSCKVLDYAVWGTVTFNNSTGLGELIVKYDDSHKADIITKTATSADFRIEHMDIEGKDLQLTAYFENASTCSVQSAKFDSPVVPVASVVSVDPVQPHCDSATFVLNFELSYTYQHGDVTVWVDDDHKAEQTFTIDPTNFDQDDPLPFVGQLSGTNLIADGSKDHVLHFLFDGEHACSGESDLFDFPNTPLIDTIIITGVPDLVPDENDPYQPTIKVAYERAKGQKIILEYFDKGDVAHRDTSNVLTAGKDTCIFTGIDFNDVAVAGERHVNAYFEGSDCKTGGKHTAIYKAPSNSSISFVGKPELINNSSCDALLYDITGYVSYVGVNVGDLLVELPDSYPAEERTYTIPADNCEPDKDLWFEFRGLTTEIPSTGIQLTAKFSGLDKLTYSDDLFEPVIPHIEIADSAYTTPECNSTKTTLTFDLTYLKQQGNLHLYVDNVEQTNYSLSESISPNDETAKTVTVTIADQLANDAFGKLRVWFDGSNSCDRTFDLPQAPFGAQISNIQEPVISDEYCDADNYTVTVSFTVTNGQGKDVTVVCKNVTVKQAAVDGVNTVKLAGVPRNDEAGTIDIYFADATNTACAHQTVTYTQRPKPEFTELIIAPDQGEIACDAATYPLQGAISYSNLGTATLSMWLEGDEAHVVPVTGSVTTEGQVSTLIFTTGINVPTDNKSYTLHVKAEGDNWRDGCNELTAVIPAVWRPAITQFTATPDKTFAHCDETYSVSGRIEYERGGGKYPVVAYYEGSTLLTPTVTYTAQTDSYVDYIISGLTNIGATDCSVMAYFEDYATCETAAQQSVTFSAPAEIRITGFTAVAQPKHCGAVDYEVQGVITTNATTDAPIAITDGTNTIQVPASVDGKTYILTGVTLSGTQQLSATFVGHDCPAVQSDEFAEPVLPELSLDMSVDTAFSCGRKQYNITVTISSANQDGTCNVLDSIAGGEVRTRATHEGTFNGTDEFTIELPATAEQHYVVVRYPATGCEVISLAIDVNTYIKPKPAFILKPIARLCNSETELILPDSITQGDIAEATLTLTDSKGKTVIADADLLLNATHDTLSYILPSQLAAGKYTAIVEARDTLDCETSASQSIEFALDGVVFSKWTDVLLVDNEGGLFTGYQWYENDKQLEGKTDQVLYLPEGMSGKSYYCVLQTAEGAIYTCVSDFGDLPRSADNPKPQSSNHITVLPNRVATNGAVTVHQSLDENLHLILMSATGKRVAEYTQQEATKLIDMPGVQGIYLLRIESDSDVQTVKIVVY